jgi:RNA polymerase sigma-70 factor, ECF subfamily
MSAADVLERVSPAPADPARVDPAPALVLVRPAPPEEADAAQSGAARSDAVQSGAVQSGAMQSGAAQSGAARLPADPPAHLESLVLAAVRGEDRARDALLGEIHPFVLRYCRGRLGRQETVTASADDVAQEVCLAVINALPAYTVKGLSFRAFVYGIAAHKVTDAFRAIGRARTEPVAELPDSAVSDDGPEHRLLATELGGRLNRLLGELTPRQRDVLTLRIMVGLSAEETAVVVGSTPGAVRVTQHRALNRLRVILDVAGPAQPAEPEDVRPVIPAPRPAPAR